MKYRRFNAKRDEAEPEIVQALEKAGWEVHRELPVDLLCLKRDGDRVRVKLLEAKTARGKKKPKAILDKRQVKQNEFCERWGVDKPTSAMEALLAVGERIVL